MLNHRHGVAVCRAARCTSYPLPGSGAPTTTTRLLTAAARTRQQAEAEGSAPPGRASRASSRPPDSEPDQEAESTPAADRQRGAAEEKQWSDVRLDESDAQAQTGE